MRTYRLLCLCAGLLALSALSAFAQYSEITYQGRLLSNGAGANGQYYLQYRLFDAETGGSELCFNRITIQLAGGMFTAQMPLPLAAFTGADRWLDLAVSPDDVGAHYVQITPRQKLTPTPFALYAYKSQWSGLSGIPEEFQDGIDDVGPTYNAGIGLELVAGEFRLANLGVTSEHLAGGAVTSGKLANRAVGTIALDLNAVTADRIENLAVTTAKLADGAVTGEKIPNGALTAAHFPANTFWSATGNSGTTGGTHFIGTTDNQPLDFKVNSIRALRLATNSVLSTPNLIGGHMSNAVTAGAQGIVIGGGGASGSSNRVTDDYGVVAGGIGNQAGDNAGTIIDHAYATVSGGQLNIASGIYATVPGGNRNTAAGAYSFAAGGQAKANHAGTFVWADTTGTDFASTSTRQFLIRAYNGVGINCNDPAYALDVAGIIRARDGGFQCPDGTILSSATVRGDVSGTLPSLTLGAGTVTTTKLADQAVTAAKIANNTITGSQLAAGAVAGSVIADGAITPSKVFDGTCLSEIRDDDGAGSTLDADLLDGHDSSYFSAGGHTHGNTYWAIGGNTLAAQAVIGTLNDYPLTVKVNNERVLYIEFSRASPNIIGGHWANWAADGTSGATIGGGGQTYTSNWITDSYSTIGGGEDNRAGDNAGTFIDAAYATVGGGKSNQANGLYATVPGGLANYASGKYSFAAGRRAKAYHDGSFVWGDSSDVNLATTAANQFIVRAGGGIWLGTNSSPSIPAGTFLNTSTGAYLTSGGAWTSTSDRNVKTDIVPVDGDAILRKLAVLPISTWTYRAEPGVRHLGPMAQDFAAAFQLGNNDKAITSIDSEGVALAAIQALNRRVMADNAALRAQVAELQQRLTRLDRLEARLRALERAAAR